MVLIINFNIYRSYLKAFEKLVLRSCFSFTVTITKKVPSVQTFFPTKLVNFGQIN